MSLSLSPKRERQLLSSKSLRYVVGIDEVGRGCWAGPLYMGAYIFSTENSRCTLRGINDSKQLSFKRRAAVLAKIQRARLENYFLLEQVPAGVINEIGLARALRLCLSKIIRQFNLEQTYFLLDGNLQPQVVNAQHEIIISGDAKIYSIALAANYAKVKRDQYMRQIALNYPGYGFEQHVGYGTKRHQQALASLGICPEHRTTYKPISAILSKQIAFAV